MARFRSRLRQLMLNRAAEMGEPLTQTRLSQETGVSLPTIARWCDKSYTFERVEADTLAAFSRYFGVGFNEILELIDTD